MFISQFSAASKNSLLQPVTMKCLRCDRGTFIDIHDFDDHTKNCHHKMKNDVKFICNICQSQWSCAEVLHYHLYSEHQSGSVVCDICGQILKSRHYLKKHIDYVHYLVRKYQCDKCSKAFQEKNSLKVHMELVHLNIKRIKCEHCDYACRLKNRMWVHTMTKHTKNPEFRCTYCDFVTSGHKTLKRHIKNLHQPSKPKKEKIILVPEEN